MIITSEHPDCPDIKVYGKGGEIIGGVLSVDTDTMVGKQFIRFDVSNGIVTEDIDIYKIVGPSIYYERKIKRLVNI